MRKFILLILLWSLALGGFAILTFQMKQPSTAFWGLVQSEKTVVRSPEAGEIQILKVNPGDSVRPGDTLLVIFRPEVERQQQESQVQMEKLDKEHASLQQEIRGDMQRIRAEWNAASQRLSQEQALWEAKIKRDRELAAPWLTKENQTGMIDSVTQARRNEFAAKQAGLDEEYSVRLRSLQERLQLNQPILQSNLDLAENDLTYWEAICEQQVIRAPHSGWVGEVMVSETEVTLKGTPLVEIWGHDARYVEGYIHENFSAELKAGQQVMLSSANDSDNSAKATIVKLGNRIVEFPDRLRKAPDIRLWGRETIIQLEERNPFLIGEKVVIQAQ